ncbi:MAG: LPP20 family lipoprotein [Nitrosomonadales bacterium]|nr:LPP20 family lipoprotein [Nitrosomonadales bacterium]
MKFSALAIITLTLLSGCASKQVTQPDWIAGDSAGYSSAQYLLGRGQAVTQEEAKDRARADVAKIFQVAVVASSDDVQKFKTGTSGPGEYEGQASRSISTHTEQIVRGIQIAELWQDPTSKNFHVLAILPRLQTAASLRQQIGQLDEATGNYVEQSRKNSDLFLKIAAANQAVESEQERESLQKSLQIVDATGRAPDSPWHGAKLKSDLDELLKRVKIASQVSVDSTPGLAEIASGALAHAGFMIATDQNPDFVLQTRMELADLGLKEGWYWQRGVLEITLTETTTNRVRGTRRWTIKSNAPDKDSSFKRALTQADTLLKQELRTAIIDMATSH